MIRLLLALLLLALPARAEEVVAALSQDRVSISTNFDGSEILIYGAIKRDAPPGGPPLAVIVTVAGPEEPVVVRRKARRAGIWVNADAVRLSSAPSFYAVVSSAPLETALTRIADQRWRVSTPRMIRDVGAASVVEDAASFRNALIRIRRDEGAYVRDDAGVTLTDETLFSATVALPSALTEGNYEARIFLTRGGRVVDVFATDIFVRKVGLERFIYVLAHERPLVYGLLSLALAILAGWAAAGMFRLIR
ncbi:TIGR02186 family protein [Jannaschia sp. Os4]|uniref:TIGR02186 family protein n=1 Tax=Jannaschia sp. Os4 TaxID=2807617 RepID=UPI001939EC84|nr:TIGR02186 family protein [Jannaschia sp. Os4]MBM2575783.1 TIGR02186 family protein [Jannaschia sp. Os4]